MPSGPDARVKITEEYAKLVGRDVYFWAWPLVNMYNRRLAFSQVKEMFYQGPTVQAPLNTLGMFTDYAPPDERIVACPNQDVAYGIGPAAVAGLENDLLRQRTRLVEAAGQAWRPQDLRPHQRPERGISGHGNARRVG
jgi:hypothetical protein